MRAKQAAADHITRRPALRMRRSRARSPAAASIPGIFTVEPASASASRSCRLRSGASFHSLSSSGTR
ncbi:MAG: hypothetical protein VYA27_12435, partial [Verrucomicrobiota bacterium]|nr:hypothetical protein [Verrucomicrobiota bacterium]